MTLAKFNSRVAKLADKISMSKTPVPGLIMGLSGTDSIVTFLLCYEALKKHGKEDRLLGINFTWPNNESKGGSWLLNEVFPWLKEKCPNAKVASWWTFNGQNEEEARWGTLHSVANKDNFWTVATVNATEKYLGTYSILAKSASMWPVATLWKTDILNICKELNVPQIAIDKSRIPDCICGRDELAAENIELIDEIIQHKFDPTKHDPELLRKLMQWVYDTKQQYDFKDRTPYTI
jgi:NH3-dependent NAD+ synthetase